ncbi:MAG TPA: hypothetical protein VGS99_07255 [Gammaproteobacteria bacterium]|nr:hypothetical protein [Gammaproteobacteria bacterium]
MSETETPKTRRRLLSSGMPAADYGVFLVATPLILAVALLLTALAAHTLAGFIWLLALTALLTALLAVGEIFQSPVAWESGSPLKFVGKWLMLVGLLWPFGYPAYLRERRRFLLGNWFAVGALVAVLFVAAAAGAAFITVTGYGKAPPDKEQPVDPALVLLKADPRWIPDPDDIEVVKTGYLDNCTLRTLEQEVNGFLDKPRWEAGASADGRDFVNIHGGVVSYGKPAELVLQFEMDKDRRGFKYHGLTIAGVPQTALVAGLTMAQMCQ